MLTETEKTLQELYYRYRVQLQSYPWEWEEDRWDELIFCLLWRTGRTSDIEARTAVRILKDLRLLSVSDLASLLLDGNNVDMSQSNAVLIAEVLRRSGFSDDGVVRGLRAIVQAAQSLEKNHKGKIQHYLRAYGERMLAELPQHFAFTELPEVDVHFAFCVWMQNTLSMPVPAWDERVQRYCDQLGITKSELLLSADNLDMNVAVLDDLIVRYMGEQDTEESTLIEKEQEL
jgi:endonuclease III